MNEEIDYNALDWVRLELNEVLKKACLYLVEYAGNRENNACLQDCAKNLHQARGPLQMVGLKLADQLASEMEEVIAGLLHGSIAQPEAVIEALLDAFQKLPDYLSRLDPGRTDRPTVLLPLINGLREVRGVPVLEESAVFTPDLTVPLPPEVFTRRISVSDREIEERARAARSRFQPGLLDWYRDDESYTGLRALHEVLIQMQRDAGRGSVARLWWAAASVAEAIIEGDIPATPENKQIFGRLDRQIKRLVDAGESVFDDPLTDELMKQLLFCIAHTESSLHCIQSIKTTYRLPGEAGCGSAADEGLEDCNGELLQTAPPGTAVQGLDSNHSTSGSSGADKPVSTQGKPALARETVADVSRAKQAIAEFIKSPDDFQLLKEVPRVLCAVSGGLRLSGQERAAVAIAQIEHFIAGELVEQHRPLSDARLDLFADAVCSIEYYIEEPGKDHVRNNRLLDMAETSLAALGYPCPVISRDEQNTTPLQPAVTEEREPEDALSYEPGESPGVPLVTDLQVIDPDADEEIVAIFIEEADEVLAQLGEQLPVWSAETDNAQALAEIRRGFHTIKGSGRIVGALALAEFAWAFENLLNRIIEGAHEPGDELLDLLGKSVPAMTQLITQVKDGDAVPGTDVNELASKAVMLSQADTQPVEPPPEASSAAADTPVPLESSPDEQAAEEAPGDDLELLDVFNRECSEHLLQIEEFLGSNQAPCRVTESLQYSLHTIAGISRTANVGSVIKLAGVLDDYFDGLYRGQHCAGADALDVLREAAGEIKRLVEQLPDMTCSGELQQQLCARLEALPETGEVQPADNPYTAVDSELLDVFIEEASEIIDAGENTLRAWAEQPDSQELMNDFQRQLHTLKGGARMVDITPIGDLSHTLESLLIRVVEGQVEANSELFVLLHDSHDHLAEMLEHVRARELPADAGGLKTVIDELGLKTGTAGDEVPPEMTAVDESIAMAVGEGDAASGFEETGGVAVVQQLQDESVMNAEAAAEPVAGGEAGLPVEAAAGLPAGDEAGLVVEDEAQGPTGPEAGPAAGAVIEAADPSAETGKEPVDEKEPGTVTKTQEQEALPGAATRRGMELLPPPVERRKRPRVHNEQVRVRADLLDDMVNHAAEINIYRARMEKQISDYRHNLGELDQTIGRLREQLRQVEIETEAHILFRYEQEGESLGHDFDPLEMDRYSNLQQLSRSLIESIGDLRSLQGLMENTTRESEALFLQQSRVSSDLQEGLLHSRMIPFSGLAPRLRRILRQSAKQLGKDVNLGLEGADGEMDRTVIDRIIAPLEHMLRNAVAHGIEKPDRRRELGKSPTGTVSISFDREGAEIVLRIEDDGAGLDIEAIRSRAIERNLLDADADLPDSDIMQFVLHTGFSTATEVTQISGRGVGMDVVNSEVKQLGGSLHITSTAGSGTTFTVHLPYTLAVNQALLVEAGEETFCMPLGSIEGVARMHPQELVDCYQAEDSVLEYAGNSYQLQHLGSLLGCGGMEQEMLQGRVPILLTRLGEKRVAFQLESILGSQEIVIKPLGAQLRHVDGISGATILADGSVVLILDVMSLSRMQGQVTAPDKTAASRGGERLHVMVVDDSITVRKVTSRLLERSGFRVLTAKDGVDAMGQLRENIPDIMLLDIEMPRMDGFELATHMRNDERLKHVPIIMITSRTGDKHRKHAKQIGVNIYLGKPYQEHELLDSIQSLIDVNSRGECA